MKPITVNYREGTISLSSAFEKRAFTPGTSEYAQLMEVRHDFPDFRLATRQFKTNTKQDHYKGLTYDYMRWFIEKHEGNDAPAVLIGFEAMIDITKGHSEGKRYPEVKTWFLNRYPAFAEFGMTEVQVQKYRAEKAAMEAACAAAKTAAAAAESNVTEFPAAPAAELGKTGTD